MRARFAACVLALAGIVALFVRPGDTGDLPYFLGAARELMSAGWANVFAEPSLQIGPLQLLLFGLADHAGLLPLVVQVGTAGLLWVAAGRLLAGREPRAQLGVGLAAVGLGLTYGAYQDGHLAQVVVPLLWVLAGLDAREGRTLRAGALVGLSAGFELWGLLGAVVFVLAPGVRSALEGLAAEASLAVGLFLPFILAGSFRMFDYRWQVEEGTLLSLVVEPGTRFTWTLRLLQGAAALGVGAAVAWTLRHRVHAVWLAPLAVVSIRLALDPVRYPWYWLALETIALLGVAELVTGPLVVRRRLGAARAA
jgi:hypothetical protein